MNSFVKILVCWCSLIDQQLPVTVTYDQTTLTVKITETERLQIYSENEITYDGYRIYALALSNGYAVFEYDKEGLKRMTLRTKYRCEYDRDNQARYVPRPPRN
jgi:hypothetical protein